MSYDVQQWARNWSPAFGTKGDVVAAMYTEDGGRWDAPTNGRTEGRSALAAFADAFFAAASDALCEVRHASESEDGTVAIEWTWSGTHTGDMEGWPARGEQFVWTGCQVLQTEGGLIRDERAYWDMGWNREA